MCGTSVQMWQQLVGGNVMMYYVVYVFSMAGLVRHPNPEHIARSILTC